MDIIQFAPVGNAVTVSGSIGPVASVIQFDGLLSETVSNQTPPVISRIVSGRTVRLWNQGPNTVFVELVGGQGLRTALATSGLPIASGASIILRMHGCAFVAAVTAAGSATLFATPGEGGLSS